MEKSWLKKITEIDLKENERGFVSSKGDVYIIDKSNPDYAKHIKTKKENKLQKREEKELKKAERIKKKLTKHLEKKAKIELELEEINKKLK